MKQTETVETTRLHPILVRAVAQALLAIFKEGRKADKVIEQTLKQNPKAGSRDRAFIAETTYEVVRYYRFYREILGRTPQFEPDFWQMVGVHFFVHNISLPDWNEFKTLKIIDLKERVARAKEMRAVRESIPDWLEERGTAELSDRWEETLHWLNKPAQVVLRANRLRTNRDALQAALLEEGVETHPFGPDDALVLNRRQNIFTSKQFREGGFELQDYSSQLVAPFLAPAPGMRVVDACAGGGGKTLHLAALMANKGSLIALDTFDWKLKELKLRARRARATNIETRVIENRKVIKRLYNSADRLLLDVPCSGLGVLRRNPDSKWKVTPENIENLRVVQQDILQSYCQITKPGGRMVYATCSILPSENQEQVAAFLASEPGKQFKLLEEKRILPQDEGFDGFYMALLERS